MRSAWTSAHCLQELAPGARLSSRILFCAGYMPLLPRPASTPKLARDEREHHRLSRICLWVGQDTGPVPPSRAFSADGCVFANTSVHSSSSLVPRVWSCCALPRPRSVHHPMRLILGNNEPSLDCDESCRQVVLTHGGQTTFPLCIQVRAVVEAGDLASGGSTCLGSQHPLYLKSLPARGEP